MCAAETPQASRAAPRFSLYRSIDKQRTARKRKTRDRGTNRGWQDTIEDLGKLALSKMSQSKGDEAGWNGRMHASQNRKASHTWAGAD